MAILTDTKTEKIVSMIRSKHAGEIRDLLVVGCGSGVEAAILAQQLNARVTGIDLNDQFNAEARELADLRTGDATELTFADGSFDYVFSFHALEHIDDPKKALSEINRVLRNDGGYWIGTPNRSRIIGYIGAKEITFRQKVLLNSLDWKARLAGRFRNELGAHAGFTSRELEGLLRSSFTVVEDVTKEYFSTLYPQYPTALRLIAATPLSELIYPSVYFSGVK